MARTRTKPSPTAPSPPEPLDDEIAALYLAMLQIPDPTRDSLRAQGISAGELDRFLPVLEQRRMIQQVTADSWNVVPPDVSMPAYAAELEARARMLRTTSQALSRVYLHSRSERRTEATSGAVLLESVADVSQALHQVTSGAQEWVLSSRCDSPLARYLLEAPRTVSTTPFLTSRGASLQVRLIIDSLLLPSVDVLEIMQARTDAGDDVRLTVGVPFTAAVNDQGLAMIDLGADGGSPVGILLDTEAGSGRVRAVLEFAWQLGTPWRPGTVPASRADRLEPRDRTILRLMAGGVSDAAIARQLSLSSRTVERRVRVLLDRLNATTRFQAGVLAARQGLI
ncbi:helix-turn-helix transcriptional regulator [Flexivirga caeni]|uniref:helix-turn-helix transcriptional regulator n=1 Tax=Flexivirga caeni TaxID=2294115 RepID=UPI001315705D|nr:LuxR C-terminal-related transcriptional regulator [Flexivirga caeni]